MLSIFYPISKLNIPHGVYPTIFLSNSGKDPLSPEYILLLKGSVGQFKFYLSQKSEFNTNLSQNAGLFNSFTKQNYQSLQKIQALKLYLTISPEISKNTNNTLNSTKDLSVNLLPYKKHFFFF